MWWLKSSDQGRRDVESYLKDEFERRPTSIGKHILWLTPSLGNADGKKIVDDLFPLSTLAELAEKHSSKAYSTDYEKNAVLSLIKNYGAGGPSRSDDSKV